MLHPLIMWLRLSRPTANMRKVVRNLTNVTLLDFITVFFYYTAAWRGGKTRYSCTGTEFSWRYSVGSDSSAEVHGPQNSAMVIRPPVRFNRVSDVMFVDGRCVSNWERSKPSDAVAWGKKRKTNSDRVSTEASQMRSRILRHLYRVHSVHCQCAVLARRLLQTRET
jgi:hypothetical protein